MRVSEEAVQVALDRYEPKNQQEVIKVRACINEAYPIIYKDIVKEVIDAMEHMDPAGVFPVDRRLMIDAVKKHYEVV